MANPYFSLLSRGDGVGLRRAENSDLDAVMSLERRPGYEEFVGRSSRAEHDEMLASKGCAYLLGFVQSDRPFAFAILRDLHGVHGNLYLQRVAVDAPGQGRGVRFLTAVIDWAFAETHAQVSISTVSSKTFAPGARTKSWECLTTGFCVRRIWRPTGRGAISR